MKALTSKEILDATVETAVKKSSGKFKYILLMGILAGAYIAIGGFASTMASYNLTMNPDTYGLGKLIAGCVFPVGLMMVILCGGELFTGNCLIITGIADKRVKWSAMLRNWAIVYIGNFIGALIVAFFMFYTDMFDASNGLLGAAVIKTAVGKLNLDFMKAVVLGIMCNWLVCLAVWMATGGKTTTDKIFAIFFIILPFIIGGFEHCVANMYFIPAGMMAATNDAYVSLLGVDVSCLTVGNLLLKNLLPVTIGNIIGGSGFVGMAYWLIHRK